MSADVIDMHPFVSVREQVQRLGTHMTPALIREVRKEQRAGRDGQAVAGHLLFQRTKRVIPPPPLDAA